MMSLVLGGPCYSRGSQAAPVFSDNKLFAEVLIRFVKSGFTGDLTPETPSDGYAVPCLWNNPHRHL